MLYLFGLCLLFSKDLVKNINLGLPNNEWVKYCQELKNNYPPSTIFIIPPEQECFRVYAERAVIVDYRACPYREADIIEWKNRLDDLKTMQPRALAKKYKAVFLPL